MAMYFDRRGRPIKEEDALDAEGVLKDGFRTRVALFDSQRARLKITDGAGSIDGLSRPGFRLATTSGPRPRFTESDAAYFDHKRYLNDAWKNAKPDDDPEDEDEHDDKQHDGQPSRDATYVAYEAELRDAWKGQGQ